jgi:hypothetical protein
VLHASSVNRDGELTRVRAKLERDTSISDRGQFQLWLEALAACTSPATPKSVDLIAHATARGGLMLGDWEIDAGLDDTIPAFFARLRPLLRAIGAIQLRLLGCRSAQGRGARNLEAIQAALGPAITVLGAKDLLYAADFDAHGLTLTGAAKLTGPRR